VEMGRHKLRARVPALECLLVFGLRHGAGLRKSRPGLLSLLLRARAIGLCTLPGHGVPPAKGSPGQNLIELG